MTCLKGYSINTHCCRLCTSSKEKESKKERKRKNHTLITVITEAAGFKLLQGLKFPDTHTHTHTHLQNLHTNAHIRNQSETFKAGVLSVRPQRQQSPSLSLSASDVSKSLPCSRVVERACPRGAPVYICILIWTPTLTSTHSVTCWRRNYPGQTESANFCSVHVHASMKHENKRQARIQAAGSGWGVSTGSGFFKPLSLFHEQRSCFKFRLFLASSSHPNCPPCLFDCTLLLSGFFRDKAQQNEACWLGFLSPGLRAHSAARF